MKPPHCSHIYLSFSHPYFLVDSKVCPPRSRRDGEVVRAYVGHHPPGRRSNAILIKLGRGVLSSSARTTRPASSEERHRGTYTSSCRRIGREGKVASLGPSRALVRANLPGQAAQSSEPRTFWKVFLVDARRRPLIVEPVRESRYFDRLRLVTDTLDSFQS